MPNIIPFIAPSAPLCAPDLYVGPTLPLNETLISPLFTRLDQALKRQKSLWDLFQPSTTDDMEYDPMLICAIPECSAAQHALQSGRLHLIDTPVADAPAGAPQTRKKYVWLCSTCSTQYVVQTWRPAGDQIQRRRPRPTLPFPVQPETVEARPFLIAKRTA